jgi:hypothetical protein
VIKNHSKQALISKKDKTFIEASSNLLYFVFLDKKWQRAKVINPEVSSEGTVQVMCVDSGETAKILFGSVRSLGGFGFAMEDVRE